MSLTAVGDMACKKIDGTSENTTQFLKSVEPLIADSDVRIGNLETPLTDAPKSEQSIGSLLCGSPAAVSLLKAMKMDAVTLANNHARDCRIAGLVDCCQLLRQHDIQYCGAGSFSDGAQSPARIDVAGVRIAVVGYCDNYRIDADEAENLAPLPANDGRVLGDIRRLRPEVDLIVVQLHWGYEFAFHPLISYRDRARRFAEAGADVVVCHHAHLLMGVEVWGKSLICHGLGNFIFPSDAYLREGHPWTNRSYVLKLSCNRSGVLRAEVVPYTIAENGLPQLATGATKAEILGAVARASSRLHDDALLCEIERDRTLREMFGLMSSFVASTSSIAREIAMQLRSPFRHECIQRLDVNYGQAGKRSAQILSELAEASRTQRDFDRFRAGSRARELQSAVQRLHAEYPCSKEQPGRLP